MKKKSLLVIGFFSLLITSVQAKHEMENDFKDNHKKVICHHQMKNKKSLLELKAYKFRKKIKQKTEPNFKLYAYDKANPVIKNCLNMSKRSQINRILVIY